MSAGAETIGIVGGHGAVGRVVATALSAWRSHPLRLGGRDESRSRRFVAAELGGDGEARRVDVDDPVSLASFTRGCRVVVNCAGPSLRIQDRVARAAVEAGADYVDAAGDDPLYGRLRGQLPPGRVALVSAGMMPGLSALVPRYLADREFDRLDSLTAYVGGRDRFTTAAAVDYLAALHTGYGAAFAAWRRGARVTDALPPLIDAVLPFFPRPVTAQPFLSAETERVARAVRIDELSWYTVFDGPRVRRAVGRTSSDSGEVPLDELAGQVCEAAELDLFGHRPYQLIVLRAEGESAGEHIGRTLVLRGESASTLTGATAAVAVRAVLDGAVPPGTHYAGESLDPARALGLLRETGAVDVIDVVRSESAGVEEGVV